MNKKVFFNFQKTGKYGSGLITNVIVILIFATIIGFFGNRLTETKSELLKLQVRVKTLEAQDHQDHADTQVMTEIRDNIIRKNAELETLLKIYGDPQDSLKKIGMGAGAGSAAFYEKTKPSKDAIQKTGDAILHGQMVGYYGEEGEKLFRKYQKADDSEKKIIFQKFIRVLDTGRSE